MLHRFMKRAMSALVVMCLAITLTACDPVPVRENRPAHFKTEEERQEAIEQFIAAVQYQKLLAFAAAVEAAHLRQQFIQFINFVNALHAAQQASQGPPAGSVWDQLAQCESGGNWSINTGNGYYGGLQFSLSSWRGVGGTGYPHQHSRAEQIRRAERLRANGGWGHWPACSRKLGLL